MSVVSCTVSKVLPRDHYYSCFFRYKLSFKVTLMYVYDRHIYSSSCQILKSWLQLLLKQNIYYIYILYIFLFTLFINLHYKREKSFIKKLYTFKQKSLSDYNKTDLVLRN
jgi:hypothetical protein